MQQTPLHAFHLRHGARMVPFAGYELPVQYGGGILAEHRGVREGAGLFDVSHMGQVEITGADSAALLSRLCPLDASVLAIGRGKYSIFLNERAGILDDLIAYRLGDDRYLLICNASRIESDLAHIRATAQSFDVRIEVNSRALLALQGPDAATTLAPLMPAATELGFMDVSEPGGNRLLARTGYTGESGFEVAIPAEEADEFAERLVAAGVMPAGLGARDSLRLEAGFCLYGQELTEDTDPVEANLMWAISRRVRERADFIGASALAEKLAAGPSRRLVGIRPEGKAPVRAGAPLFLPSGHPIGSVTSGGFGPSVGAPVAMGYVAAASAAADTPIEAEVRGKRIPCQVSSLPFVPHRYQTKGTT